MRYVSLLSEKNKVFIEDDENVEFSDFVIVIPNRVYSSGVFARLQMVIVWDRIYERNNSAGGLIEVQDKLEKETGVAKREFAQKLHEENERLREILWLIVSR